MEKVTHILSRKQRHFHAITPSSTITDALSKMNCENVDYLVVLDEEDRFLGVLSEHDVASQLIYRQRSLENTLVKEAMSCHLPLVTADETVETCMRLMRQFQVRHIPVFEERAFIGVITADDLLDEAVQIRNNIFDSPPDQPVVYNA